MQYILKINMSDSNKDLFDFANRTVAKNVTDTSNNSTTLSAVNLKGELLVGNGNGPSHLDPTTGSNGECLIKDSATTLGVRWGQPQIFADIAPSIRSIVSVLNLTSEQNGSTIFYNKTSGVINLPATPPNGTLYHIHSLTISTLDSPGSSIRDRCDVFAAGVQINSGIQFDVVYNQTTDQWNAFITKGSPLLAAIP